MKTYQLIMSAVCEAEDQEDAERMFQSALEEGALKYEVEEVKEERS